MNDHLRPIHIVASDGRTGEHAQLAHIVNEMDIVNDQDQWPTLGSSIPNSDLIDSVSHRVITIAQEENGLHLFELVEGSFNI